MVGTFTPLRLAASQSLQTGRELVWVIAWLQACCGEVLGVAYLMKQALKTIIVRAGLERPARLIWAQLNRLIWAQLQARGWAPWQPLVPEEEFTNCVRRAIRKLQEAEPNTSFGDYLEFGVSRGTSLSCVDRVLREEGIHGARLIGFDSFEGLPPEAAGEGWIPGRFKSSLATTRQYLAKRKVNFERVMLVEGWFKDTLTSDTKERLGIQKTSLIMIDCDIYSASKEALEFSAPHIVSRAVVLFDDWGWGEEKGVLGQKEAFSEFLTKYTDITSEPLPSYNTYSRVFLLSRLGLQDA